MMFLVCVRYQDTCKDRADQCTLCCAAPDAGDAVFTARRPYNSGQGMDDGLECTLFVSALATIFILE